MSDSGQRPGLPRAATCEPGGLPDVREARRALLETVQPTWLAVLASSGGGVAAAGLALSGLNRAWLGLAVVGLVLTFGGRAAQRRVGRRLPVRLGLVSPWSGRVRMIRVRTFYTTIVVWVLACLPLFFDASPIPTAIAVIALGLAQGWSSSSAFGLRVDPTGVDSFTLEVGDHTPTLDPAIAARESLMVAAVLSAGGDVGADLIATVLGIETQTVLNVAEELRQAEYLEVREDWERPWLRLTAEGKIAYRRHLRALGA